MTSSFNRATSVRRSSTSVGGGGGAIEAMEGGTASRTLSARVASWSRVLASLEEASTIRTFGGRRWRKNLRRGGLLAAAVLSPSSCCIRRSSCVGRRSPNSMECRIRCILRCSGMAVRVMNCCLRVSYGLVGTSRMRSRTSVANSGESDATTYSYFVLWVVMPRVLNWAFTWANHTSGSAGQKGGSFKLTAEMVLPSPSTAILLCRSRRGLQCRRCQVISARAYTKIHDTTQLSSRAQLPTQCTPQ